MKSLKHFSKRLLKIFKIRHWLYLWACKLGRETRTVGRANLMWVQPAGSTTNRSLLVILWGHTAVFSPQLAQNFAQDISSKVLPEESCIKKLRLNVKTIAVQLEIWQTRKKWLCVGFSLWFFKKTETIGSNRKSERL